VSVCYLTANKPFVRLYHGENKLHSMRWWYPIVY